MQAASQAPSRAISRREAIAALGARGKRHRNTGDLVFNGALLVMAGAIPVLAILLAIEMLQEGSPALRQYGFGFITGSTWNPVTHDFAVLPAIWGTVVTSALALVLAVPIGLGAAIFLAELAPRWIAQPASFLIEMLAAIPSVIIGLWGLFIIVPVVRQIESFLGS